MSNPKISREEFENSSLDSKMLAIFDELRFIRDEQVNCSRGMAIFEQTVSNITDKINQVVDTTNMQSGFIRTLAYKSIDLEARSRRNNLIFRGLMENYGENCVQLVFDFMRNRLEIDTNHMYIARAHRLGRRNANRHHQIRPIIVNFRDFGDIELVMSRVKMLSGTPFSVDIDFPKEIQEARSKLWPRYKELKRAEPRSRVQIVYPAKLIHNGRVVADEFPEWDKCIRMSRVAQLNQLTSIGDLQVRSSTRQTCHEERCEQPLVPMSNRFSVLEGDVPAPNPHTIRQSIEVDHDDRMNLHLSTPISPAMPRSSMKDKADNSDETLPKSIACDATNPACNSTAVNDSPSNIRGRPRSRQGPVRRKNSRSERRSQSFMPYKRLPHDSSKRVGNNGSASEAVYENENDKQSSSHERVGIEPNQSSNVPGGK